MTGSLMERITPSMICGDLCNLTDLANRLERLGCRMLHVDLIDGRFSPSMPIGIDMIRQLRKKTRLLFDVHIMALSNPFFVSEMIDLDVAKISFHVETEYNPAPLLRRIRAAGIQAGLALCPATVVPSLEYLIEEMDYVLLMQIDPGYAHLPGEKRYAFMDRKIRAMKELLLRQNPEVTITLDGRVETTDIPRLAELGADHFVSGTRGVFRHGATIEENWRWMIHTFDETAQGEPGKERT